MTEITQKFNIEKDIKNILFKDNFKLFAHNDDAIEIFKDGLEWSRKHTKEENKKASEIMNHLLMLSKYLIV